MANQFKTFIPATDRSGIPESIKVIVNRHISGEVATAIVAPPRYGKSDIIRLSAMELIQTGNSSAALALAPWDNLADQLVDSKKTNQMVDRYMYERMPLTPDVYRAGRVSSMSDSFHETSSLQHLFTSTIQLAQMNLSIFQGWVERCMSYGARPIVYVDEGQLLSKKNEWGRLAQVVESEGAHIVLLTGTPYRADCQDIPGFEVKTISRTEVEHVRCKRIDDEKI